ncbi:transposase [Motilimonas sp. E26]|nr:transposase [Motilimonas sp. E26]
MRADGRVPLTNNEAERRLRRYIVWRRCSYGVRSHRGGTVSRTYPCVH